MEMSVLMKILRATITIPPTDPPWYGFENKRLRAAIFSGL
jgi:hypothetical protein